MILGIDPGERRIGLAVADLETRIARPLEVVDRTDTDVWARLQHLLAELEIQRIVVGRPTSLSGEAGHAVSAQQQFIAALRGITSLPISEWDERLTTVLADRSLREAGASRDARKHKRDAVAAQLMLQGYLDAQWH